MKAAGSAKLAGSWNEAAVAVSGKGDGSLNGGAGSVASCPISAVSNGLVEDVSIMEEEGRW